MNNKRILAAFGIEVFTVIFLILALTIDAAVLFWVFITLSAVAQLSAVGFLCFVIQDKDSLNLIYFILMGIAVIFFFLWIANMKGYIQLYEWVFGVITIAFALAAQAVNVYKKRKKGK